MGENNKSYDSCDGTVAIPVALRVRVPSDVLGVKANFRKA